LFDLVRRKCIEGNVKIYNFPEVAAGFRKLGDLDVFFG